jgi:vacuolar-type H+-ATPase subunit E/Vma4
VHAADRLAALIHDQAASEIGQILADAREAATRTMSSAEAEVESLHDAATREGEARGRRKAARLLSEAQAAYRRDWLWEREKLVREVLQRAQEELEKFPALPDASRALVALVSSGLRLMPIGSVVVRVPPTYVPLLDGEARAELGRGSWSLEVVADCVPGGGACLETVDGRLCFDGSFTGRLRRQEVILRKKIIGELFLDDDRGACG